MQPKPTLPPSIGDEILQLCELMVFLRSPAGCNWDQAQTLQSLRPYLLEESYEVLDAIEGLHRSDRQSVEDHRDELGDLLFQIVFQAEIQRENQAFDFGDVCKSIREKLIRRHPHLFVKEMDKGGIGENPHWDRIKQQEHEQKNSSSKSVLDGPPQSMPALMRAQRIAEKAAKVGFDWPNMKGVVDKLDEEIIELKDALSGNNQNEIEHELGDALFSLVNIARHLSLDAESCLRKGIKRFEARFRHIENELRLQGKAVVDASLDELEGHWQKAKSLDQ